MFGSILLSTAAPFVLQKVDNKKESDAINGPPCNYPSSDNDILNRHYILIHANGEVTIKPKENGEQLIRSGAI
jgi:hypothetical protein